MDRSLKVIVNDGHSSKAQMIDADVLQDGSNLVLLGINNLHKGILPHSVNIYADDATAF